MAYTYIFAVRLSDGREITKEVGARNAIAAQRGAWDFTRRHYRDANPTVLRLLATNDPSATVEAES